MEIMDAIRQRKSYRNMFKESKIPREDLKEILEAGYLAPSGCNQQTTYLIGVDEPALVRKLAEIYGHEWALTSTAAILVLTKEVISYGGCSFHVQDYSAAVENLSLAATGKGYATVWIEGQIHGEKSKKMGELLNVPSDLTVAVYLPLGIPAVDTKGPVKKPFEERVWLNQYGAGWSAT